MRRSILLLGQIDTGNPAAGLYALTVCCGAAGTRLPCAAWTGGASRREIHADARSAASAARTRGGTGVGRLATRSTQT